MLASARCRRIIELVEREGSVSVQQLAEALNASESTIRRDLVALDEEHLLSRVHGGAMSLERAHVTYDLTLSDRSELHTDAKERIARHAASLIRPGEYVYIDSGTTTQQLVACLPPIEGVTFVTDSIGHARALMMRGMDVQVLGGKLKPETEALVGADATATLRRYHFARGFWGTNGVTREAGFTTPDADEAEIKRLSLSRCAEPYVICDVSKFGMVAPVTFAEFGDASIITTGEVDAAYRACGSVIVV